MHDCTSILDSNAKGTFVWHFPISSLNDYGRKVGGLLFADDFVGVCNSAESLQSLIDTIHGYCSKWTLRANVSKSAVLVFSKASVSGE